MSDWELKFDELNELAETSQFKKLKSILDEKNEMDVAEFIGQLPHEKALATFRILQKDLASEVFACMDPDEQQEIIRGISDTELNQIIEDLYTDDAVDMIEEMPANVARRILRLATPETRAQINQYLKYPENSAGSIMTSEYVALRATMNVEQAFSYIRHHGVDKETIYTCYVIDNQRKLIGVITLKDLLMNPYETVISEIMDDNVIQVTTTEDREDVSQIFTKYDLLALPVVDSENRLVGIVTVDDAVDVMEQEATEDIQKMAAMAPSEKPYLKTSVFTLARNRIVWLMVLMVSSMCTGGILSTYEAAFAAVPLLVTFIPMLTDTGGNAGSQASTMIIRSMTLGDIVPRDILRVLWKEFRVSLLCGFGLALVNYIRLVIMYPGQEGICLVVSLSVMGTVIMSKTIGCTLPIVARCLHLDPTLMASPLITTIVDAASLILYFQIASMLLPL